MKDQLEKIAVLKKEIARLEAIKVANPSNDHMFTDMKIRAVTSVMWNIQYEIQRQLQTSYVYPMIADNTLIDQILLEEANENKT